MPIKQRSVRLACSNRFINGSVLCLYCFSAFYEFLRSLNTNIFMHKKCQIIISSILNFANDYAKFKKIFKKRPRKKPGQICYTSRAKRLTRLSKIQNKEIWGGKISLGLLNLLSLWLSWKFVNNKSLSNHPLLRCCRFSFYPAIINHNGVIKMLQ